jgi:hypothetical protein
MVSEGFAQGFDAIHPASIATLIGQEDARLLHTARESAIRF